MTLKAQILFFSILVVALFFSACSTQESSEGSTDYLVKVGNQTLDKDIFLRRYKLSEDYTSAVKIEEADVKQFIDKFYMNNLLFRAEGYRLDLDEQAHMQAQYKRSQKDLLIQPNGPLHNIVVKDVNVQEGEIRKLYDLIQDEVKFAHILLGSLGQADSIHSLLEKGGDFNQLVLKNSLDINTVQSNGVIPRYFTRGYFASEMEQAIFSLSPGQYSSPVKSGLGFHIIKIIDRRPFRKRPFPSMKQELSQLLRQRKTELRFEQYIQSLKEQYHFETVDSVMSLLLAKYQYFSGKRDLPLSQLSPEQAEYLVVKYDGGGLTAKDLIQAFNKKFYNARGSLNTKASIAELANELTRNELMFIDAIARGLDKNPDFQNKLAYVFGNHVQIECQQKLVYDKVTLPDEEVKAYYQQIKDEFGERPFWEVENLVQNRLRNIKQQQLLNDVANSLKSKHPIKYNEEIMKAMISELNQAKQT